MRANDGGGGGAASQGVASAIVYPTFRLLVGGDSPSDPHKHAVLGMCSE